MSARKDTLVGDESADAKSADWRAIGQLAIQQMHSNAVATQNPIYAWRALQFVIETQHTSVGGPEFINDQVVLPAWIARYLLCVSDNISQLALGSEIRADPTTEEEKEQHVRSLKTMEEFFCLVDGFPQKKIGTKEAAPLLGRALGLTQGTSSKFTSFAADQLDVDTYHRLSSLRNNGMTYEAALQQLAVAGARDVSVVRKNAQDGERLIAQQHRHQKKATTRRKKVTTRQN